MECSGVRFAVAVTAGLLMTAAGAAEPGGGGARTAAALESGAAGRLSAAAGGLRVELDAATGALAITHGDAAWTLRGEHAGAARVGSGNRTYAVGGAGEVPVVWRDGGGRLCGEAQLDGMAVRVRITFAPRAGGRLFCRLDLTGRDVGKVDWVQFPASPVLSGAASRIVVPQWLGLLVPAEGPDIRVRRTVWERPLSMRFVGGTQGTPSGDRSFVAILKDSLYRSIDVWRSGGASGVEYLGEASHAERSLTRRSQTLEFQFVTGNYVAIAGRYRDWMRRQPGWRTLASRERPGPPGRIAGAQLYSHVPCDYGGPTPLRFTDLIPRMKALKSTGIERAIFHVGGWNRDGYDATYPDILPANPRCGGDAGMRALTDAMDDLGYVGAPHDDIAITSEKSASFDEARVSRAPNGVLHNGGFYRDQQYRISTSEAQIGFAERNMPEVHRRFPRLKGYLFDVATSYPPLEDYAYSPPLPRETDIRRRAEVFHITRAYFAGFLMCESIMDWAVSYLDAGFMAEEGYLHRGDGGWSLDALHGEIVPLWELALHDSMLAVRDASNHVNTKMETEDPFLRYLRIWLKTLRAGALPPAFFGDDLTGNVLAGFRAGAREQCGGYSALDSPRLMAAISRVSTALGDLVYGAPMTGHAFVGGDLFHERTEFATRRGPVTVLINSSLAAWDAGADVRLAPLGFMISGPGLLAFHAERIGGRNLSAPTLAVQQWDPARPGRAPRTLCAFGDAGAMPRR